MQVYFRLLIKSGEIGSKADSGIIRKIFGKYLYVTNTLTCGGLMAIGDAIQQEIEIHHDKHKVRFDWDRINRMFWVGLAQGPPQHVFYKWLDRIVPKRDFLSITKKIILDQLIASPVCLVIFFVGLGLFERHEVARIISELKSKFLITYTADMQLKYDHFGEILIKVEEQISSNLVRGVFFHHNLILNTGNELMEDVKNSSVIHVQHITCKVNCEDVAIITFIVSFKLSVLPEKVKVDWIVWPPVQMINFYYLPPKYRVIYINIVTMLYDVFLSYIKHDIEYCKYYVIH